LSPWIRPMNISKWHLSWKNPLFVFSLAVKSLDLRHRPSVTTVTFPLGGSLRAVC
jgi:hypothetical protein